MRRRLAAVTITLLVAGLLVTGQTPAGASPADEYSGPYFGADNLPPGCVRDMSPTNPENICYHMKTDLNALDSPQVDVLVMVPVSPTAERDMRIMRQSVEMWEAGIDYLADEMGLNWLKDGIDFHITVDYVDPAGGEGGEFTTYPIVDPEIVVIATNPVGGAGIGIDPVDFIFTDEDFVPCHGVQNPFDFEAWESLPGFDRHHDERVGTYAEDCAGAGGNICFAINGAIDPDPERIDLFQLFDLVSHEFGHCLTLGHVGDGGESLVGAGWGPVPTNDIMAYSLDPPDLSKCVSTLDVEGVALRMSRYLDVDGDGTVDDADVLVPNDPEGDDLNPNPFQVQHPSDHLYASGTGSPHDCPQPDVGVVPGPRTEWTPTPVATTERVLTVTSPQDGDVLNDGTFSVTGTVEHESLVDDPTEPQGSYDDADNDASTPVTEILELTVAATTTHVEATIRLADLWPSTEVLSPTSYSLLVDDRRFDSFVRYPINRDTGEVGGDGNPKTFDVSANAYMPAGTSTWDLDAKTVTFHISRDYLGAAEITAPYFVGSRSSVGLLSTGLRDDSAPEVGQWVGVSGARVIGLPGPDALAGQSETVTFEHDGGNTFYPEDSTLGLSPLTTHFFRLEVEQPSNVAFTLDWTDNGSDLDLYVTGDADSGSTGATTGRPESFVAGNVEGVLDITVDPWFVTDETTYTLTATISAIPDADGDGVADPDDLCPSEPGEGPDGCPLPATEHVHVYVDGVLTASQDVDTSYGPDGFDIPVQITKGTHELLVVWEDDGEEVASRSVSITYGSDSDGDGVAKDVDNCPKHANADQANMDGDAKGDVCDSDIDGDGHSNDKEEAHGTDPEDPNSYPDNGGPQS